MGLCLAFFRLGFGKGLYVHLLVYVQGDGVNLHGYGRNHVRGLFAGDEGVQLLDIHLLGAYHIGGEEFAGAYAGLVKSLYRNVFYAGEFPDNSLHLLEFDAEAANFHLSVFSAHVFYLSVLPFPDNVSGAVCAGVHGVFVKGIVHKHLGRFVRSVEISQTHLGAGNPKFSGFSFCHLLSVFDHVRLDVFYRPADGNVLFLLFHLLVQHIANGFRGAVAV